MKLLYGEKIVLSTTSESLQFLQSLDYFELRINIEKIIEEFDIPVKDNFLSYMEELRHIYPDDESFPKSIIHTLGLYIELFEDEDDIVPFFTSFWSLLPKKIRDKWIHCFY